MHRRIASMVVFVVCVCNLCADDKPVPNAALSVHIISGAGEYKSEASLQEFSKHLQERYKIETTASWGKDGVQRLAGLDALKDAELMIVFVRRMKLDDQQTQIIRNHWRQGKPIIGIRTASHAFDGDDNKVFDLQVLGNNYQGHHGKEEVKVTNNTEQKDHPVLDGVKPFTSTKLYKCGDLPTTTTVLQTGDIGSAAYPVTIVNQYNGGRIFYTSLGVPDDFQNENFRRLLINAIFWTTHRNPSKMKR